MRSLLDTVATTFPRPSSTFREFVFRKSYRSTVAVGDVSFEVYGGEIVGLIGPNGTGKTTTIDAGTLPCARSPDVLNYSPPDRASSRSHLLV